MTTPWVGPVPASILTRPPGKPVPALMLIVPELLPPSSPGATVPAALMLTVPAAAPTAAVGRQRWMRAREVSIGSSMEENRSYNIPKFRRYDRSCIPAIEAAISSGHRIDTCLHQGGCFRQHTIDVDLPRKRIRASCNIRWAASRAKVRPAISIALT